MKRRAILWLATLGAILVFLPAVAGHYILSVVTLFLFFAYAGQAWNIMMGFAGQLSLGHSLYLGVGAYAAAGALFPFRHRSLGRAPAPIALCVVLGATIGASPFATGSPAFTLPC